MTTYLQVLHQINYYKRQGYRVGVIGFSEDGRPIPYVFIGNDKEPCVFITAGIHAREHIGCHLVLKQIEFVANEFAKSGFKGGIYFIPMLNPDGNVLVSRGLSALESFDKRTLTNIFKGQNLQLLKANARGVDLNVNFDANWGTGAQNTLEPNIANYIGEKPFSESETRAIASFTKAKKPLATISYHCLGREIYWEFGQDDKDKKRDFVIAEYLNEKLDYCIVGDSGLSAGGYKDWCIQKLKIPSYTIELGLDDFLHPFTEYEKAKEDIARNLDLPIRLLSKVVYS